MDNEFLSVMNDYVTIDNNKRVYFGIYTKHPLEIARTLPRPKTPFPKLQKAIFNYGTAHN